jgi:hypothetical protein
MAKDIMAYARQNVAQARYARRPSTTPQRRATIDPTLLSGKKAATGAPLASRPIEGGPALPSPQEYNPIIDAESGEDPNAPRVETQQPIENRGSSARYMLQTGGPKIDLSFLVPERVNKAYDPSKAIGGENVPYQESKGIGGFFRRFLGDESNRMNIEAQQAQGAEWRADAKAEKERANKMADRLAEIEALDKGPAARFAATEKRLDDKAIQDEIERNNAIDLGLVKEGNEDVLRDADMVRREAADAAKLDLEERRLKVAETMAGRRNTQVIPGKDGGYSIFDIDKGEPIGGYSPGGLGMVRKDPNDPNSPMIPGTTPGGWEPYVPPVTVPKDLPASPQVDRTTGAAPGGPRKDTMGGKLPPPEVTPMRAAAPSPEADASLLGRFKTAMPSLSFNQPSARGYQVAPITEGDVAQQAMEQIAYPLRASVAEEAMGEFENPQAAYSVLSRPPTFGRLRKPSATEMSEARKAGNLIRQMYAE